LKRITTNLLALVLCLSLFAGLAGCRTDRQTTTPPPPRVIEQHASTLAVDQFDFQLQRINEFRSDERDAARLDLYKNRWPAVQRAVAYHGTTHRDAFYGSRAYWHTGSTRGIGWALDHAGDLDDAFYVAGKGNVRVAGDVNKDIEISGNSIVHILGDLNATLDLKGICEVVIAGNLTKDATIICDGQLELFVGGDSAGILGSTNSSTIIIDGNASGTLQAGEPATTVTITGDLTADIPAPKNKDAVLTLRVDGYAPTATMLDLATAGFTRVNATLGTSDAPPGLYPQDQNATRPTARWVVLRQNKPRSSEIE
jgi:hypothetical protein